MRNPGRDVRTGGECGSLQSVHVEIGSASGIAGISGLKKIVRLTYDITHSSTVQSSGAADERKVGEARGKLQHPT